MSTLSCATLYRRESSATKFDRIEMLSISTLFHWLKTLTHEGWEETGIPGENPQQRASENAV